MTRRRPRPRTCPGCGKRIWPGLYACGRDWARLPPDLRLAIVRAWGRRGRGLEAGVAEHIAAKAAARQWFTDHPRNTTTKEQQ